MKQWNLNSGSPRRQFLKWLSAAPLVAGACGSEAQKSERRVGLAQDNNQPTDPTTCEATTPDVLGPFHAAGAPARSDIAPEEPGERLAIEGLVVDENCSPVAGATLDVWQADQDGSYHSASENYRLRGLLQTDAAGKFELFTIKPGHYSIGPEAFRPAHIHFIVSAPGFAPVTTQLYFAGDPYLPPNDGCGSCGSDDPDRIVTLDGDATHGWSGAWRVVLKK